MPTPRQTFEELLAEAETIDRITIDLEGSRFVWRLFSKGREFVAVFGRSQDVASMVRSTEILVNTEMGIPPPEYTAFELN